MSFHYLLSILGILLVLPILGLIALAWMLPITSSGIGYLVGFTLVISGLIIAPWRGKLSLVLFVTGFGMIALVAGARLTARDGDSNLKVMTLPQGEGIRWINRLVDEQDSLIFGEAIFHQTGGDSAWEHEGLIPAFYTAYSEMRQKHGMFGSPVLGTYLGVQTSKAFDTVIVEPEIRGRPETAVIFLHGYMGNVTAQCWEIAQAAGGFGAITVCPSTDWTGRWWQPEGQEILGSTFRYLREQGVQKFYLGGFSNGGFSISRLVSTIAKEDGLHGLFFINGISDGASIRDAGLPVLILQGVHDERVPATVVRPIAEIIGDLGTYVEIEGDHFMIMKQPAAVQSAFAAWLEKQETAP